MCWSFTRTFMIVLISIYGLLLSAWLFKLMPFICYKNPGMIQHNFQWLISSLIVQLKKIVPIFLLKDIQMGESFTLVFPRKRILFLWILAWNWGENSIVTAMSINLSKKNLALEKIVRPWVVSENLMLIQEIQRNS